MLFLQAIANRAHPQHQSMLEWAGAYHPDAFDPEAVVFGNPRKRWKKAFDQLIGSRCVLDSPRRLPLAIRTLAIFHYSSS